MSAIALISLQTLTTPVYPCTSTSYSKTFKTLNVQLSSIYSICQHFNHYSVIVNTFSRSEIYLKR